MTDELHPFTPGGAGRIIFNLIRDGLDLAPWVEFHVLVPANSPIRPEAALTEFGGRVVVHRYSCPTGGEPWFEGNGTYPPVWAFTDSECHARSLAIMLFLRHLEDDGLMFDFIEFTDYCGLAFCTIQEKGLGIAFGRSEISIRLQSSLSVLQYFEPVCPGLGLLGTFEMERLSLESADRVIAHLPEIAEFNRQHFGFDRSWLARVSVEFPPIQSAHSRPFEVATAPPSRTWDRDLLFITRIKTFKQPDVFVRGAALFMKLHPQYRGNAILACLTCEPELRTAVEAMVPEDLRERFHFIDHGPTREALMDGNIVVIPSSYESLCLAAYEAPYLGATLVLNGRCLAFGENTPFKDRVNCYKYDGSAVKLANTLACVIEESLPSPFHAPEADRPYWERRAAVGTESVSYLEQSISQAPVQPTPSKVSVIITNFNLGRYLEQALGSLAQSTHPDIEVILVDDASTSHQNLDALHCIQRPATAGAFSVRVVRNPVNLGPSASRNIGIDHATGKYIVFLDADDALSPTFLELACNCLDAREDIDVVVPTTANFESDEDLENGRYCDYWTLLGNAVALGSVANRVSCATALMRRSVFSDVRFDESLAGYEDWDLYLRLASKGHRFIVTNDVHYFYRRRPGSRMQSLSEATRMRLWAHLLERRPLAVAPGIFRPSGMLAPLACALGQQRSQPAGTLGGTWISQAPRPKGRSSSCSCENRGGDLKLTDAGRNRRNIGTRMRVFLHRLGHALLPAFITGCFVEPQLDPVNGIRLLPNLPWVSSAPSVSPTPGPIVDSPSPYPGTFYFGS